MARLDTRSLVERITDELRAQVINGRLTPGSRVRQEEVASELGVSRTPLREALRQLQGEGWFVAHPRQGIVVGTQSLSEITNIAVARMALEPVLARLSAVTHDDDAAERLRRIIRQNAKVSEPHEFFETNRDFHFEICGIGSNSELTELGRICRRYWEQFSRYRLYYWRSSANVDRSERAHQDIGEAWIRRDSDLVERLIAHHIWAAISDQIAVLYPNDALSPGLVVLCDRYGIDSR